MRVDVYDYESSLSQTVFDEMVNGLLVNIHEFSRIACLEGKGYNVISICNTCGLTINDCARRKLIEALLAAQRSTEEILGFSLTPQYHVEEFLWDGRNRVQLKHPGVSAVNIQRTFSTLGNYPVSPYIIEDVPMVDSGSGFCIATLDADFVANPNEVWIRNTTTHERAQTQRVNGYPKRNVSGDWEVAMSRTPASPACNDGNTYGAQHCRYMVVDVPSDLVCVDGDVLPCYPNSNQLIPLAKPVETVGDSYRYWFYPWSLVDSAFEAEEVDLVSGEFYKLLSQITFKCVKEVTASPVLTMQAYDDDCCEILFSESVETVTVKIVDAKRSSIEIYAEEVHCPTCSMCVTGCCCAKPMPLRLRVYYKTDPSVVGKHYQLGALKEGIANLVAAELPLSECNCPIPSNDNSFIGRAQKAYTEVRVNGLGQEVWNLKFGNLHGQLVYAEQIKKIQEIQRLRRI